MLSKPSDVLPSVLRTPQKERPRARGCQGEKKDAVADPQQVQDQRNKFIAAKKKEFEDDGGNLKQEADAKASELWHEVRREESLACWDPRSAKRKFIR